MKLFQKIRSLYSDAAYYPTAIFLEWVSKRKFVPSTNVDFPKYMSEELKIQNPMEKYWQMVEQGYLIPAPQLDSLT